MLTISCYCSGRVAATLDVDNKILQAGDEQLNVSYNNSFAGWVSHLTEEEKRELKEKKYVYAFLPRTKNNSPYLLYELIGVDRRDAQSLETIYCCGHVYIHNPEYEYVLLKVPKGDISFSVRLEVPNSLLNAVDTLQDCFVHFDCTRVETSLVAQDFRIIAYPNEKVKIVYQHDYLSTTGYLLDYSLDAKDYCLVKPIEGEYKDQELKLYRFSNYLKYSQPFCQEVRQQGKEVLNKYKDKLFKIKARNLNGRLLVKMIRPLTDDMH